MYGTIDGDTVTVGGLGGEIGAFDGGDVGGGGTGGGILWTSADDDALDVVVALGSAAFGGGAFGGGGFDMVGAMVGGGAAGRACTAAFGCCGPPVPALPCTCWRVST